MAALTAATGAGKSVAASQLVQLLSAQPDTLVLARFVGVGTCTSTAKALFSSVVSQLSLLRQEQSKPRTATAAQIIDEFARLVATMPKNEVCVGRMKNNQSERCSYYDAQPYHHKAHCILTLVPPLTSPVYSAYLLFWIRWTRPTIPRTLLPLLCAPSCLTT